MSNGNPNWSYWDIFKDMFTEDFWQTGGTTDFFTDPETANHWVQEHVLSPYEGISIVQKTQLIEASNLASMDALTLIATTLASPVDGTLFYWEEMKKAVRMIAPNDSWLNEFFKTGVKVAKDTTERTFLTDSTGKRIKSSFPWWIIGLAGLVFFMRK